jgi:dTDP-4-dehydrorhamnose reductase
MMKILVTGASGQVGFELRRTMATLGEVVAVDLPELNFADLDAVRARVREIKPQLIVNAAAYTAVDKAESDPDLAMLVNRDAPGVLAEEARRLDAPIVHYSTDYVYDGTKAGPYVEDDAPNPMSVYGRSKLAGDQAVIASGAAHVILRTSWVYGARGGNFYLTMRKLAAEREELRIVNDQTGAPTWCRMLAQVTAQIVAGGGSPAELRKKSGLYHLTASGQTTWFGFAGAIVERARAAGLSKVARLVPITTAEYPLPAKRPTNSILSCEKIARTFGVTMPAWDKAFALCVEQS